MTSHRPKPLWLEIKERRMSPDDILVALGMVTPPVDVRAVAEAVGAVVHLVPDPGWSGALTVNDNHAVIWVSMGEAPERKRFTIAHELGHLLLHDTRHAFRDQTYDGSETESEANRFAADLLMPMWMVGPVALTATDDEGVARLAEMFGVSKGAMNRRLLESFGVKVPPL